MDIIELERWKPSKTDPRKLKYAGQRPAREVFEELKHRLESQGYLPDEYFLMNFNWENGRKIPKDADISCTTDYGGSEGVYLDVYLKWYEDGKPITSSAQASYPSSCRMRQDSLIALCFLSPQSQRMALRGPHRNPAKRVRWGKEEQGSGRSFRRQVETELSRLCDDAEQRERQEQAMSQTEQILRRMTGSITEYVNTVGMRPLRLSDYDRAVLAVQDGELSAFKERYPKALKDHADDLLIAAASRPGAVGRKMTVLLLADVEQFQETAYRAACLKAIGIDDFEKVSFLLEQAGSHVPDLPASFHGEMASEAYLEHRSIAKEIIKGCSEAQITGAPSCLLEQFATDKDFHTLSALVERGISGGPNAWRTLHMLTCEGRDSWIAEELLKKRMWVETDDYNALHACVQNDAVDVCKLLLDGGVDFDVYQQWAKNHPCSGHEETVQALADHWVELQAAQEQGEQAPSSQEAGGMILG